jgi:hypothetical protein
MESSIFYTYKYVWEDGTPYYVGKGKEDRAFRNHGDIPVPEDRNRIIFLIENVTEKEAFQHERDQIKFYGRKDLGTGPLLNRTSGGQGNSGRVLTKEQKEKCRESAKIGGKIGGKISGNKHKENKTGVCGQSLEKIRENGKKGGSTQGNRNKENKTGMFSRSPEKISEDCKKGGKISGNKHKENKTGVCGRSPEKMSEDGKKGGKIGGKISTSQKWQCTETGYISTAGGLTCYQNKRGIDTSNRIKIDGSRIWKITFECGKVVITNQTLKDWAKENGYSYQCLLNVRGGYARNNKGIIKVVPL